MRIGYPMLYFLKFKDLTCNFCAFSHFYLFLGHFLPDLHEILSKFRKNVGLQAYCLGLVLIRSWTSLRTAVFSSLSQNNWEDQDRWYAWTGYSPVRFSVPFRSYEPDLEALSILQLDFVYQHEDNDNSSEDVSNGSNKNIRNSKNRSTNNFSISSRLQQVLG